MEFFSCILLLLSSLLVIRASPQPQSRDTDWKYSVGWNGTISASSSIGTPANTSSLPTQDGSLQTDGHIGGIYACVDADWEGNCSYAVQPLGECINLADDWYRQISSIGPDPGNKIVGYAEADCQEDIWGTFSVAFPGSDEMGDWNDLLGSFYVYSA